MAENKMADVNRMIRELEEADIDDDGVCVRYFPYKRDVPILVNALKMYRAFMTENKMAEVARLFGKELGEGFLVKAVTGKVVKCMFGDEFLWYADVDGIYVNNFFVSDTLLRQLIVGQAVIVDESNKA